MQRQAKLLGLISICTALALSGNQPFAATAFFDDFNRANSTTVGNGWNETELASSDARIQDNRTNFPSSVDAAAAWRAYQGGAGANDITISFIYRKTVANGDADGVSVSHGGGRGIYEGVFLYIDVNNSLLRVQDGGPPYKGEASYPFLIDTDYAFQWDINPDNSMRVWVWPAAGTKPPQPQLTIAAFTPVHAAGSNWGIGHRMGAWFDDFRVETPAQQGQPCSTTFSDDFNRATIGPNWSTCANVSIVSNALQFFNTSGTPTNCPNPTENYASTSLVAAGTQVRDGAVQFYLDNGGPTRANNTFVVGFGGFFAFMAQDTLNDTPCRRRVQLKGPDWPNTPDVIAEICDILIDPGVYEFSVNGSAIRFRNVSGGTPIDLQATDTRSTSASQLEIRVNEDTTRVDDLILRGPSFVDSSAYGTVLFPPLCTQDAAGLPGGPGPPFAYSAVTIGIHKGTNDEFYLSSKGTAFAAVAVDDAVHINGTDSGLGPYIFPPGVPPFILDVPIERNLVPLPPHDITSLVPLGSNQVVFELLDTQREIYGNTAIYLVRDCGLWLSGTGPTAINWLTHDDQVTSLPPEFDVRYGSLSELRGDGNFSRASCLGHFFDTPGTDTLPNPTSGDGYYYLVRGLSSCEMQGYGDSSLVPDPRDALDASAACPSSCNTLYSDDFNRATIGPDWSTCANVSIVSNALQFFNTSGTPTNCPNPTENYASTSLVAVGTQVRDGAVQFYLDNGGPTRANNTFVVGFGGFFAFMAQDTLNDTPCRRRVQLKGPDWPNTPDVIAEICDILIDPGVYEFSVNGSAIRFRNVSGGTPIDLQATDTRSTSASQLEIRVNEDTTRVDNLVLKGGTCP